MHKHGRHNTEAIFSLMVIRIHLFKSILGVRGCGGGKEQRVFQVDQISQWENGIFIIGDAHSLRQEEMKNTGHCFSFCNSESETL